MNEVIQTIIAQVSASAAHTRGYQLVLVDEMTIKWAKAGRSVSITYVPGRDTYTVRVHRYDHGKTFQTLEDRTLEDVYVDSLENFFPAPRRR